MRNSCVFVIRCYKSPLNYIVVYKKKKKKKTIRFEKATSQQGKIYIMKKSIMLHSCMLHHFIVAIHLLELSC